MFRDERPRDTFVEAAIASREGTGIFYSFGPMASSNTLDADWADSVVRTQGVEVEEQLDVKTLTLAGLLDSYLPSDRAIDFLNVDVEGLDLTVLETNDWDKYRPVLIAVEEFDMDLSDPSSSPICRLLASHGYRFASRSVLTNFYVTE